MSATFYSISKNHFDWPHVVSAQSKAPSGPGWQVRSRRGPGGGGRSTAPWTRPPGRPLDATQLFLYHLPTQGARSFLHHDDQWHPFGHPGKHDPWKLNYHANYSTCCRRSSRKTSSDPCLNGVTDGELMEGLGRTLPHATPCHPMPPPGRDCVSNKELSHGWGGQKGGGAQFNTASPQRPPLPTGEVNI